MRLFTLLIIYLMRIIIYIYILNNMNILNYLNNNYSKNFIKFILFINE